MSQQAFSQLAPFVREFIYRHRWESLHDFQAQAIACILGAPQHALICSATASGKTEAALLPIITALRQDPPQSIGALYIGPLKALINDQFLRLDALLEDSGIPAQSWHGDVAQSKKQRFLKGARGILQITPESLEAMLMRRHQELTRLFGDLRFVVIDEAHAFLGSDRGRQVICQLERLGEATRQPPRRVGLSATIGEPALAMDWLRGASDLPVRLIDQQKGRPVSLALEHFLFLDEDPEREEPAPVQLPMDSAQRELVSLLVHKDAHYAHMHKLTQRALKSLIFANSRQSVEDIGLGLRDISKRENLPDFYHVHHGNVSAPLRESAEEAMRAPDKSACVAATVTLELGIDLGQLDQVLQVDATHTVSSFVQRLGRSGRRQGDKAKMFFYCTEEARAAKHIGEEIPWNLLQTIAIIQLYAEDKWLEPPQIPRLPLSLLYHQTMSILYAHQGLTPPQLARRVLGLSPFRHVSAEQFRALLRHLIDIDHIQQTERGDLIIGYSAEKIVNDYRFFAVFSDDTLYRVRDKSREIGTIPSPPAVDDTLVLAGYIWRVLRVDYEQKIVEVRRAGRKKHQPWLGGGADIHTRVLQRMRRLLLEDSQHSYMRERAVERLRLARDSARREGVAQSSILSVTDSQFLLLPWHGTRQVDTLLALLRYAGLPVPDNFTPYYMVVSSRDNESALRETLRELCAAPPSASDLAAQMPDMALQREKYDPFVPPALLREAYASDCLDVPGAVAALRDML